MTNPPPKMNGDNHHAPPPPTYESLHHALSSNQLTFPIVLDRLRRLPPNSAWNWKFVMEQFERRRYDRVMDLMDQLQLDKDTAQVTVLVVGAARRGQFGICLKYLRKSTVAPLELIKAMINQGQVELAMKTIYEFKLEHQFKIADLVSLLLDQGSFASAQKIIAKDSELERLFPPERIVERMITVMQWDSALATVSVTSRLKSLPEFSTASFIRRMISARDWVSTVKTLALWGVPLSVTSKSQLTEPHLQMLRLMIRGMIEDKRLFFAMRKVVEYHLDDEFIPRDLVKTMIAEGQYQHALRFIRLWRLEDEFATDITIMRKSRNRSLTEFRRLVKDLGKGRMMSMTTDEEVVVVRIPMCNATDVTGRRNSQDDGDIGAETLNGDEDEEILMPKREVVATADKALMLSGSQQHPPPTPQGGMMMMAPPPPPQNFGPPLPPFPGYIPGGGPLPPPHPMHMYGGQPPPPFFQQQQLPLPFAGGPGHPMMMMMDPRMFGGNPPPPPQQLPMPSPPFMSMPPQPGPPMQYPPFFAGGGPPPPMGPFGPMMMHPQQPPPPMMMNPPPPALSMTMFPPLSAVMNGPPPPPPPPPTIVEQIPTPTPQKKRSGPLKPSQVYFKVAPAGNVGKVVTPMESPDKVGGEE